MCQILHEVRAIVVDKADIVPTLMSVMLVGDGEGRTIHKFKKINNMKSKNNNC